MPSIVPNLWFDSEAEQAAEFYVSIFPRSKVLRILRYAEAGPGEPGTVVTVPTRGSARLARRRRRGRPWREAHHYLQRHCQYAAGLCQGL